MKFKKSILAIQYMKTNEPMKPLFIPLMSLLLLCGCGRQKTFIPGVDDVLAENPQLQRVLDHCKDDSLKYRAALFLIENLPYHATNDAPSMDAQLKLYELHSTGKYSPEEVIDSVSRAYGRLDVSSLRQTSDVGISPEYLIENIEWAFKVWREQPWGKNVPFSLFCEYILPYRVGDERLVSWRKEIYERYNPLLDSIRKLPEAEDSRFVSEALFDSLRKVPIHFTGQFEPSPHIGPKTVEWRSGSCKEFTDLLLYVYRAVGLPCAKDIMLMRGNRNAPHSWNVMFDKEGRGYYFTLLDNMTDGANPDAYWDPKGKVYRSTFSLNRRRPAPRLSLSLHGGRDRCICRQTEPYRSDSGRPDLSACTGRRTVVPVRFVPGGLDSAGMVPCNGRRSEVLRCGGTDGVPTCLVCGREVADAFRPVCTGASYGRNTFPFSRRTGRAGDGIP